MNAAPRGTSPSSTLSPESRPASMLPAPIPMARKAQRRETPLSSACSTSLPKYCRFGLEQHAGEPEVGDAEHGEPERLVVEQVARAAGDFAEGIPAEGLRGAGWRDARDAQAGGEADGSDGDGGQRRSARAPPSRRAKRTPPPAMPSTMATKVLISSSALPRERSRSPQHFRHDAVFGGAEDGGVQAHQEDDEQHAFGPAGDQRGEAEQHDGDFEELDGDQDAALADEVGEVAGVSAEEQRGSVKTAGTSGT